MKTLSKTILAAAVFTALTACSSEKDQGNTDPDSSDQSSTTTESNNKFYAAAVKKIQIGPPAIDAIKAKSIVDHMIADGTIGLGEINGMNLAEPDKNADRLNAALEKARKVANQ